MNRFAFKEWAAVCAALAAGWHSLILRKGGVQEGQRGFDVEHRQFWLFPTNFHQHPESLVTDAEELIERVAAQQPPEGTIQLSHYAVVEEVFRIHDRAVLPALSGLHIWSDETVSKRFDYRSPGLIVLPVRLYSLAEPVDLPDSPYLAGCRSWVNLPKDLPTAGLTPVLSDEAHAMRMLAIRARLSPERPS